MELGPWNLELSVENRWFSTDPMCLILFAFKTHPHYSLILAANRDEFYERPTEKARFWQNNPGVLAGRDLKYGGTWMGITRAGRFAAVTNYRDKTKHGEHSLSRGHMVKSFLTGSDSPEGFLENIRKSEGKYNGFNLLVGNPGTLAYYSNQTHERKILGRGIYGLSNHLLDTPWPKVVRSRGKFMEAIEGPESLMPDLLFEVLSDSTPAGDDELPDTGFGDEWEKILSPPFISSPTYGTRASTVLLVGKDGHVSLTEWSFSGPEDPGSSVNYEFQIAGYK